MPIFWMVKPKDIKKVQLLRSPSKLYMLEFWYYISNMVLLNQNVHSVIFPLWSMCQNHPHQFEELEETWMKHFWSKEKNRFFSWLFGIHFFWWWCKIIQQAIYHTKVVLMIVVGRSIWGVPIIYTISSCNSSRRFAEM